MHRAEPFTESLFSVRRHVVDSVPHDHPVRAGLFYPRLMNYLIINASTSRYKSPLVSMVSKPDPRALLGREMISELALLQSHVRCVFDQVQLAHQVNFSARSCLGDLHGLFGDHRCYGLLQQVRRSKA